MTNSKKPTVTTTMEIRTTRMYNCKVSTCYIAIRPITSLFKGAMSWVFVCLGVTILVKSKLRAISYPQNITVLKLRKEEQNIISL